MSIDKPAPKLLKEKADKLRAKKSFKEAVVAYLNSVLMDRNNPQTYFGLGMCYKNLGNISKAIENFEKSALLDSKNFNTFYELGLCHLKNETPCKAIKCFIQAVTLEPDNPDAIYNLGIAHELCEEQDMAMMIYQKLIENSPSYINAYIRKSSLLMKMELYRPALNLFADVLKINPNCTKIYSDIGKCYDKLGKQTEAKRFYRKFLTAEPNAQNANLILKRVEKLKQLKSSEVKLSLV